MGQHWSHLTPTKRIQLDAFIRAGMKPTDIAKELGVHHTTIYRELKRCTYEHLNSDYTTETRYNPEGAQARYEANLRAKGPELKIGNDYELADYLIAKIRDEKYSPEAAIGEAEVKGWPFKTHICASTAYNYIRGEIFGDELTVSMLPQHGKRHQPERPAGSMPRKPAGRSIEDRPEHINDRSTFGHWEMDSVESCQGVSNTYIVMTERKTRREIIIPSPDKTSRQRRRCPRHPREAKYGVQSVPADLPDRSPATMAASLPTPPGSSAASPAEGTSHRGLLLPPVPAERARIQ